MSFEIDFRFLATTLQWLVTGAVAFYAHMAKRDAANGQEVNDLRQRVTALEEQIRHLPDLSKVNEVSGDLKALQAQVQGLRDVIAPLAASVERMNSYLLQHK